MNTLYLFTGKYPYSQYVECFLEDEIVYLSKAFDRIVIVPTRGDSIIREVPSNCIVKSPVFPSKIVFLLKGLFNHRSFSSFACDFFKNRVFASRKKLGVWLKGALVINNLLNSKVIHEIEDRLDESDVCYYYWGKWSNLLTLFLRKKCHHVSRFHGAWDLWEEDYDDYAPLRRELSSKLDRTVFISKLGENYFHKKYPKAATSFNPLGSADFGIKPTKTDDVVRIVSCSTVYPLKRVDLIFKSVKLFSEKNEGLQLEWTHMGGGPNFDELKALVAANPVPNLSVKLLGNLDHSVVIEKFRTNSFDVFINLSTSEGVPVSIMEAISFDVPVVATAVGGTPEIVTNESGILVSSNPKNAEVAEAISIVLNRHISSREFWEKNYSARNNYKEFAQSLLDVTSK